jgi:hypothetical protein
MIRRVLVEARANDCGSRLLECHLSKGLGTKDGCQGRSVVPACFEGCAMIRRGVIILSVALISLHGAARYVQLEVFQLTERRGAE